MKTTLKLTVSSVLLVLLAACGGGGGDGTASTPVSGNTELEGTWVYASAGHTTGTACGLDIHGGYEVRVTFTFEGSTVRGKSETCAILTGNTGGFVQTDAMSGSFVLGDAYMTAGSSTYKAINITTGNSTLYSGYALNGTKLKFAEETTANDGSTPDKRHRIAGTEEFVKQ